MDAIKTVKLTKIYKDLTAVDALDLTVHKGELFSLLGVNGAGKTTAIRMLSCLAKPTSGDAFLNGCSIVNAASDVKKLIGVSPQETALACLLLRKPDILFLDEPTLGLDVIARSELWDVIRELKGRITIILTTHYMEEAEMLSDRIGIMKDGRLLALGTAAELMAQSGRERFEDAFVAIVKEAQR